MAEKKVKAFKLRSKTDLELTKELDTYKQELSTLRVAKVAGGTAAKLARIKVVLKIFSSKSVGCAKIDCQVPHSDQPKVD